MKISAIAFAPIRIDRGRGIMVASRAARNHYEQTAPVECRLWHKADNATRALIHSARTGRLLTFAAVGRATLRSLKLATDIKPGQHPFVHENVPRKRGRP
jgi:hypothetical protein